MPSQQLLIINADDFGFAPGVNRGIVEAHEAGTLSSASMMVNTPAFAAAAALARESKVLVPFRRSLPTVDGMTLLNRLRLVRPTRLVTRSRARAT